MAKTPKLTPTSQMIVAEERRVKVLEMRVAGHSLREIAGETGTSLTTAYNDIRKVFARIKDEANETAEDEIRLDRIRLDRATKAVWLRVVGGDLAAIDSYVKLRDARARLLGLDAPKRLSHEFGGQSTAAEAARLVRQAFGEQAAPKLNGSNGANGHGDNGHIEPEANGS